MTAPALEPAWLTENWDDHDPWGSCLSVMGSVCDALFVSDCGDFIPEGCEYRPAMGMGWHALDDLGEDVAVALRSGSVKAETLREALLVLDAVADEIRAAGRDY